MTLHDKIAALPEWPKEIERVGAYKVYKGHEYTVYDDGRSAETPYQTDLADAALARLALAREFVGQVPHAPSCKIRQARIFSESVDDLICTCGRDALLAALEGPK